MTSLHYTLIALGVALVGAVMLYNFYQERRSRQQAERLFQLRDADVPLDELPRQDADVSLGDLPLPDGLAETRIEPRIQLLDDEEDIPAGAAALAEPGVFASPEALAGPTGETEPPPPVQAFAQTPEGNQSGAHGAHPMAPESPLDGEIEYIARLRYAHPSAILFATLQENLRRISKPIRMVGRRGDGGWEPVLGHAARTYDTVELSLLLADRAGPVSEVQLDTFCQRLYEFATEHGGAVSCQDRAEAVARAQALDAFCAEVDMLIGLNVIPPTHADFVGRGIHDLAVRAGLVQGADGIYSLRDADGRLLFTLTDGVAAPDDVAHGISLLFDVPRVAHGLESFDRMTRLGLELAEHLGGHLVDDGGRPVSQSSLAKDRASLETIYARMAAHAIPAGGERALRLFS